MSTFASCNLADKTGKLAVVKPRVNLNKTTTRQKRGGCGCMVLASQSGLNGGSVLDQPITLPNYKDKASHKSEKPPIYQVLLHNDDVNQREYVVRVLLKVVKGLSPDEAVNIMNEAHVSGISLVISCAINVASRYCHGLRNNGLIASIEPSS